MKEVISIAEIMPGHYEIHSQLDSEKTANVLMQFAIRGYQRDANNRYEKMKQADGSIINPHTGLAVPGNGGKMVKDGQR